MFISLDDGETFYDCSVTAGSASCVVLDPVLFSNVETLDVVAYDLPELAWLTVLTRQVGLQPTRLDRDRKDGSDAQDDAVPSGADRGGPRRTLLFLVPTSVGGAANYVQVTGNSMYPTLRQGDVVLLTRDDRYQVGDIIAYKSNSSAVRWSSTGSPPYINGRYAARRPQRLHRPVRTVRSGHPRQAGQVRLPGAATVTQRLTEVTGMVVLIFGVGAIMMIRPRSPHGRHRRRAMKDGSRQTLSGTRRPELRIQQDRSDGG
ncbi:MAG: S24 family peptidase [Ilumatobacteraceae bacterium]